MRTKIVKCVTLGISGAGKSTILKKWKHGIFDNNSAVTVGFDYLTEDILINKRNVRAQVWDFSGQNQYHSFTKSYLNNAQVVFCVMNIQNEKSMRDSFERLKLDFSLFDEIAQGPLVIEILANKTDLVTEEEPMRQFIRGVELWLQAKRQKDSRYNIGKVQFVSASLTTKQQFQEIIRVAIEKSLQETPSNMPARLSLQRTSEKEKQVKKCC